MRLATRESLWRDLKRQLTSSIKIHDALFEGNPNRKIEGVDKGQTFSIKKLGFPRVGLEAVLEIDGIQLHYTSSRKNEAKTRTWKDLIPFRADDRDHLQFVHNGELSADAEKVAQFILKPLKDPDFNVGALDDFGGVDGSEDRN